jgi:hypothetical protein
MASFYLQGDALDSFPFYPDRSDTTSHSFVVITNGKLGLTKVPSNLFHGFVSQLCLARAVLIGRSHQDLRQGSSQVRVGVAVHDFENTGVHVEMEQHCQHPTKTQCLVANLESYHPCNPVSDAIKATFVGAR